MAHDDNPDRIISRILQRDRVMQEDFSGLPEFAGDDAVAILFDPFHDHRNAMVFATNPNGAEFEGLITDEGREFNVDWRSVWEVRSARTTEGWSAEFAIPFRSLRYPDGNRGEPWGFNVYRIIRRSSEEVLWSGWSRDNEGFARVSRAGHIEGLTDLPRHGLNIEVKPFLLAGGTEEVGDAIDTKADFGGDIKYEVRPGLLLDLTANTDFAQVEIDDQQVNLTRFSLFFPEKRDFFLENSGVFEFGSRAGFGPPPVLMFFSRRIGISEDGQVPIIGGGRLTGRVGGQTVGFMNVVTNSVPGEPRGNFAVGRVKRDIGENNYAGAMVTDRRQGDDANTVGGVDFSWWPTGQLNLQGFAARSATKGVGGDDTSYRLALGYVSNFFNLDAEHLFIGADFEAKTGFVLREDLRQTSYMVRLVPRPQVLGIRRISVFSNGEYVTGADGQLQDWRLSTGFSPTWNSGEDFVLFYARGFTRLDEEFDLTDDVIIPVGDYDVWELGGFGTTSPNSPVILGGNWSYQGFFDGTLLELGGELTVRPNANIQMTAGFTRNSVDIPWGTFDADIGSLRLTVAASTKLVGSALFQYNSLDSDLSANIRLNYVHRPGSDLFLVFTENRGTDARLWDFQDRGFVAKLTYLTRF